MENKKDTFIPMFGMPFGEKKLFLSCDVMATKHKKHNAVLIGRKIEAGKPVPVETIIDDELFAYAVMTFKSKKSITTVIDYLTFFRDEVFGKTDEQLERSTDKALKNAEKYLKKQDKSKKRKE